MTVLLFFYENIYSVFDIIFNVFFGVFTKCSVSISEKDRIHKLF